MKNSIEFFFKYIQIFLLHSSYYLFKFFVKKNRQISWVIGVDEIASIIFFLGDTLKPSTTVSLRVNPSFYNLKYDFDIKFSNKYLKYIYRLFYGPLLLGYLANKNTHFMYIWHTGFLLEREDEFKFLKSINKKIVCSFMGNDIRSILLTIENAKVNREDVYANYYNDTNPELLSIEYDEERKKVANVADKYADLIFNAKHDQLSYLKSEQFNFVYMYDKDNFFKNDLKFSENIIKILHAPSNAIYKGTQLIRAAIKKLEIEGYDFEYIELQNVPNSVVLENLKSSHIVLNQFYALSPGVFGVEAMANHCAVLMSADPSIETGLPQDSKDAWMITKYWEVYDNLKYLLDNPKKIKYYADKGYEFAYKHYTYEAASIHINRILKENGVIN